MRNGTARPRRGSAILMVILFIVLTAAVAAALLPVLIRVDRIERAQKTATILADLGYGLYNTNAGAKDFRQSIGRHAGRLSQLTVPIDGASLNVCGNGYSGGQQGNWPGAGPFTVYPIVVNGAISTPMGMVNDVLVRDPPGGGAGFVIMSVSNADMEDVEILDMMIDLSNGGAAGAIRWGTVTDGITTMNYYYTIDTSC